MEETPIDLFVKEFERVTIQFINKSFSTLVLWLDTSESGTLAMLWSVPSGGVTLLSSDGHIHLRLLNTTNNNNIGKSPYNEN